MFLCGVKTTQPLSPSSPQCPPSFQERSSKSLLANVLDIDDDYRSNMLPYATVCNNSSAVLPGSVIRLPPGVQQAAHSLDDPHMVNTCVSQCNRELGLILKEIRVVTNKMRKDEEELEVSLVFLMDNQVSCIH